MKENVFCKGSLQLGTGCKVCNKCIQELETLIPIYENRRFESVNILYRNWKGEEEERFILPLEIKFGSNEFHKEHQCFIYAYDFDKKNFRTFALNDTVGSNWLNRIRS